jgi:FdhE protein
VTDRLSLLDRRLAAVRKSRPDIGEAIDLQELLIRTALTSARPAQAEPFPLPREAAAARVRAGVPLLHDQPVALDVNFAADLFSRLVNALAERRNPELAPRLEAVIHAATSGALDPEQLFAEAFVQHTDHLAAMASPGGVDAEILATLAQRAVAPILQAYAERLLPILERVDDGTAESAVWQRGYCPICGAWPLLGELRGVELSLWLRCSACGSGWRGQRLVCPYCGNADHHALGTLIPEGENRYRLSVCDRCKGYLKVVNAFDPPPPELLPIEDAATMHLDVAAIERGYQRPQGSGFRIELAVPEHEWLEELA